jgi:S1-C subfamily serine protease
MPSFARFLSALSLVFLFAQAAPATDLAITIKSVKPSIVGIGTYQKTRSPPLSFRGTGFAVGDGLSIITNAHVIPDVLDSENKETLGIIIGSGPSAAFRPAVVAGLDREHDLAHLKITGTPLPPMKIGDSNTAVEGQDLAFTGFPLGMMLGPYHSTHRATISSIAPLALPVRNASKLDPRVIAQLKSPFTIFQLDGTAYPGNSGSPLYDPETGTVVGVINLVFVKGIKETAITNPSGITYAIPANHVTELLKRTVP